MLNPETAQLIALLTSTADTASQLRERCADNPAIRDAATLVILNLLAQAGELSKVEQEG